MPHSDEARPGDIGHLVSRAKQGDPAALEAVLSHVAPAIHRFGRRMCRNPEDAEDVLQDALLAVATHLSEFEGRSSLTSWSFALARSACSRRRRGLKNRPAASGEQLPEAADPSPTPDARIEGAELAGLLSQALDSLSEEHREVIQLRDIEGLSAPEAAAALGISVDALKSRLHRARAALRLSLRPRLEPARAAGPACPDVVALWSKKLEGELDQIDCANMEKHLAACPSCGAACDALKRALLACQRLAGEDVPPAVGARVRAALKALATRSETR